jgi:4-amino-4-deoxy-L-arabinose transferase-like glycosyltransferase
VTPGGAAAPGAGVRLAGGGAGFGTGWTKLLGNEYGPQIGWLYPLALLALVFGLAWTRRTPRTGQVRAGFVMWGVWLATFGLIFSEMSTIPHTAYMSSLAPPLAALSAAGIVMFWRAYRGYGWRGWVLPAAVAAELAWALYLWRDYGGFLPWARNALAVAGVAAIVVMVAARAFRRSAALLATAGLAAGVAAMLAAPAAWAASVLDTQYGGSSFNASAGPAGGMGGGGAPPGLAARYAGRALANGYPRAIAGQAGAGFPGGGGGGGGGIGASATTTLTAAEQRLYAYVSAHRDGASYLMAVSSWSQAGPYILATGQEVMDMGGFSGTVPEPTLAAVQQLVSSGQLRFFLLSGGGAGAGFAAGDRGSTSATIATWVRSACAEVPAADYGAAQSATAGASGGTQALYLCGSPSHG